MKKSNILLTLVALCLIMMTYSCDKDTTSTVDDAIDPKFSNADQLSSEIATDWLNVSLDLTQKLPGYFPCNSAKAYAYTNLAVYEAIAPGMKEYVSLAGSAQGLTEIKTKVDKTKNYHWGVVANAAYKQIISKLYDFSTNADLTKLVNDIYTKHDQAFKTALGTDLAQYDRSVERGIKVADEIFNYMLTDYTAAPVVDNNLIKSSVNQPLFDMKDIPGGVPVGYQYWVPVTTNQRPLLYYWGLTRTFSPANNVGAFTYKMPFDVDTASNSKFWAQAKECDSIYRLKELNPSAFEPLRQTALYWNDDPKVTPTPAGHSLATTRSAIKAANFNLEKTVATLAQVSLAASDAFVICFRIKYDKKLFSVRPMTFINQFLTKLHPEYTEEQLTTKKFQTTINTPPFPEYASCHSTQTSASMQILTNIFGDNHAVADSHNVGRSLEIDGTPRVYTSFFKLAEETANSRLYGGVHFRFSNDDGIVNGKKIGNSVWALKWKR